MSLLCGLLCSFSWDVSPHHPGHSFVLQASDGVVICVLADRLEIIWRLSYGLGLIPLVFMVIWRIWFLKESAVWKGKKQSLKDLGEWAQACASAASDVTQADLR